VFIDHYSRFTWFYPLKLKSDFYSTFVIFQKLVENQLGNKIKIFQCDGGGEFISKQFLKHLEDHGIQQSISCPYTPQKNGMAERKHRHIVELGLSMLFQSKLPLKYWLESFFTANFVVNLLPTSTLENNEFPFQKLHGKAPEYSALRAFGCACYPTLHDYASTKFDPRSLKCVFLGYNEKYKGYRCLYPPTGIIYISRHVLFDEATYPFGTTYSHLHPKDKTPLLEVWYKGFHQTSSSPTLSSRYPLHPTALNETVTAQPTTERSQNDPAIQIVSEDNVVENQTDTVAVVNESLERTTGLDSDSIGDSSHSPTASSTLSPVSSQHDLQAPVVTHQNLQASVVTQQNLQASAVTQQNLQVPVTNDHSMLTRAKQGISKPNRRYVLLSHKVSIPEPKTANEALKHPGWNNAMHEEMGNCKETNTWSLVPYTPNMNVLGSMWVFRTKLHADGSLDKLKARLVAKGFNQEEGIDYLETYSPVVRTPTVRLVLHVATVMNWELKQMDVKNAFLHVDLTETVYMRQPAGFVDKSKPDHVCLLHKSLYGLKQSPRAWFDKFSNFLLEFGFVCSLFDPSLFVYSRKTDVILLLLYVDDMVLTGNNSQTLIHLLAELNKQFRMKDMGQVHYFLGIQVQSFADGLFMSQQKYVEDLLVTAAMEHCSPMPTPLPLQLDRIPNQAEIFSDPTYFRSLAGKLQYLTLTRPDIQFSVNYVCQKMHQPTVSDFNLLKRILRYIKGTVKMGIRYNTHSPSVLSAYSDSDYANCKDTRRSLGGYCTFMGQNIISWSSKKQPTVSRSSTEAEYRSLSEAASEIKWMSSILREIGVALPDTPELFCDNLSAVYLTANPAFHARTKHFDVDHHYVRERVALKTLVVRHIPGYQQLADIFTKSLPFDSFARLRFKLGVDCPPTPSLRGCISKTEQLKTTKQNGNVSGLESNKKMSLGREFTNTKPIWRQRSSSSYQDKTRTEKEKPMTSKACTNGAFKLKLSNQFETLDVEESSR